MTQENLNAKKPLTVSVVIPAYNEASTIGACLTSLKAQTAQPHEILLINNNCTDDTIVIAKRFPGVTIVDEPQQGLISARNRGFDTATGEIIARTDADSLVAPDWVARIQQSFTTTQTLQAVSGTGYFYDAGLKKTARLLRELIAVKFQKILLGHYTLFGPNMAVRKTAWQYIRTTVCNVPNIMEDVDLSLHIQEAYGNKSVGYDPQILVDVSMRRATSGMWRMYAYWNMWPTTLRRHKRYIASLCTWPCIWFFTLCNGIGHGIVRLYDPKKEKLVFSIRQWKSSTIFDRDNP